MDTATQERIFRLGVRLLSLTGQAESNERNQLFNEIALLMAKHAYTFLAIPDHACDVQRELTVKCGVAPWHDKFNEGTPVLDDLTPVLKEMVVGWRYRVTEFTEDGVIHSAYTANPATPA